MPHPLPDILRQGEVARLFPVLSETSKEGRTTSILLACIDKVDELGRELLLSDGQRVGSRAKLETYTEIVLAGDRAQSKDRPDGLIVLTVGSRRWTALVEAKIGAAELEADQVERYRQLAKTHGLDCVITISNQFATTPSNHPLDAVRKSRSKIPVIHWSWMHVFTTVDLLMSRGEVGDTDQMILLNELRRFLSHQSAGVKGFDRMPREWPELCKLVASGGDIPLRSNEAQIVVGAWHQETRDLALILSRMTETRVEQKLPRAHLADPAKRLKDEISTLCHYNQLQASFNIPDAAAPLDVVVDLARRTVDVGMTMKAPEDKKSTKARVNWLLRQIKIDDVTDLHLRLFWPGRSAQTQRSIADLRLNPDIAGTDKDGLSPTSFHLFRSRALGARFTQVTKFVEDVEGLTPEFYREIGSSLSAWKKPPPKMKEGRDDPDHVSPEAISREAGSFEP